MSPLFYLFIGLVSGVFGGMFGVGGASIMVPAMVLFSGLNQHQAQGTALAALLPPVGILAVLRYYQAGNVKVSIAAFICLGFLFGGYFGAGLVQHIPSLILKKMFGVFLLAIALNMIFKK
ncbi:MAG: sulfite exporter TauE/SafE family protein [Candidatus Omnitrophota bacterium]